jgi:hypothetical protein
MLFDTKEGIGEDSLKNVPVSGRKIGTLRADY